MKASLRTEQEPEPLTSGVTLTLTWNFRCVALPRPPACRTHPSAWLRRLYCPYSSCLYPYLRYLTRVLAARLLVSCHGL